MYLSVNTLSVWCCIVSASFQLQTYGDILFSLTYTPDMHKINGIILKATGLQKQDITGAAGIAIFIILSVWDTMYIAQTEEQLLPHP